MISAILDNIGSVLCIGAHADDIEIGCGGSVLRLLADNSRTKVTWVVLSGDEARAAEARQSAERFLAEVSEVTIIQKTFRDTFFPYDGGEIKEFFRELSASVQPDVIFTHRREDMHQDHRLVAELTWNAFRNHLILEYEIPKYEGDLGHPNVFFNLDEETCRRKIDTTLECFASQREKPWFTADTLQALLRLRGVESASPTGFAEGLYCRKVTI